MKEETTNSRLRAMNLGILTTLGTYGYTNQRDPRSRLKVVYLDCLAPYQGAAQDEWL
jgi:hypothetical protein